MIRFGDRVEFTHEYRSCKPKTINLSCEYESVEMQKIRLGIESDESIMVKKVYPLRKAKKGIYLGSKLIHTAIAYHWHDSVDVGVGLIPEYWEVEKRDFVQVAEIRCKGIQKAYLVPFEHLVKQD